jgi:hypothetical protein
MAKIARRHEEAPDWSVAAQTLDQGGQIVSMYHQLALFTTPDGATAAEENARAIRRSAASSSTTTCDASAIADRQLADDALRGFHADMKACAGDAQDRTTPSTWRR